MRAGEMIEEGVKELESGGIRDGGTGLAEGLAPDGVDFDFATGFIIDLAG